MSHDQIFKELLRTFFREFMELFLPRIAGQLSFETVRFLEQEFFTDFPEGDVRRTDTLAEVRTSDGTPEVVLFHIETEAARRTEFRGRMWEYYCLIRQRWKEAVFPIVIYLSPGTGGIVREEYAEEVFGDRILTFAFTAVGLPDLRAEDYCDRENPVGVALSALMRPGRLEPARRKWDALRRIVRNEPDESRKVLLTNIVENYLILSDTDRIAFEEIVARDTDTEVRDMISIYERRGIEQGIERGIEQGIGQGLLEGTRRTLLRQMEARFGPLNDETFRAVAAIVDQGRLDDLTLRLLTAGSLAELRLGDERSGAV
ncbi:MAG: Rpn family recombination-promoting nuclease/putative transposase [Capsulimonadales bacterium]|nr:Rpn family recombination-promoting nuclease/putative transposase [Capsulimonadales bacterium]